VDQLEQIKQWIQSLVEQNQAVNAEIARRNSPAPAPLGMRPPTTGEKIKNSILGLLDDVDQQPLSQLMGIFSPVDQIKNVVMGGDPLESADTGPVKAAISGSLFPKLYHGTRAPGGVEQVLREGVKKDLYNIGDVIGGAFHSIPDQGYARGFATAPDYYGEDADKYMLQLKADPESRVLPLTGQSRERIASYGYTGDAIDAVMNPSRQDLDELQQVANVFGVSGDVKSGYTRSQLQDAIKGNPEELKTKFDIDHVLYDDGSIPALATTDVGKLIHEPTNQRLYPVNHEAYVKNLWEQLGAGPLKSALEATPFPSMQNRFTWDADKFQFLEPGTGSNPAAKMLAPELGEFYVKSPLGVERMNPKEAEAIVQNELLARVANEVLRGDFYGMPNTRFDINILGHPARWKNRPAVATEWQKNLTDPGPLDKEEKAKEYLKAVILRNWDVAEPGNLKRFGRGLSHGRSGEIFAPDLGGALFRRAQGAPKPGNFATDVQEVDTLLDPNINPASAKMFEGVDMHIVKDILDRLYDYGDQLRMPTPAHKLFTKLGRPDMGTLLQQRANHVRDAILKKQPPKVSLSQSYIQPQYTKPTVDKQKTWDKLVKTHGDKGNFYTTDMIETMFGGQNIPFKSSDYWDEALGLTDFDKFDQDVLDWAKQQMEMPAVPAPPPHDSLDDWPEIEFDDDNYLNALTAATGHSPDDYEIGNAGMEALDGLWKKYKDEPWWASTASIEGNSNTAMMKWHANVLKKLKELGLEP
jgi:hypothetical protein